MRLKGAFFYLLNRLGSAGGIRFNPALRFMRYLAVDLGAESGRVMLGTLEDGRISLEELSRFSNTPIREGDAMYWNIPALLDGIVRVWPGRVRLARRSPA